VLFFNGGMSALAHKGGASALSWPSSISSTPAEGAERNGPFVIHYKRLAPGSGGHGRHRGGLGREIMLESRSLRPIAVIFLAERTRHPAPGVAGGELCRVGGVEIDGNRVDNRARHILGEGGRVYLRTPGDRGPEAAAPDRKLGYTS
jgi:N-methylhydantoinase B